MMVKGRWARAILKRTPPIARNNKSNSRSTKEEKMNQWQKLVMNKKKLRWDLKVILKARNQQRLRRLKPPALCMQ